jgi:hypothetical protein
MQLKTISRNAAMTVMAIAIAYPAEAQPIPANARNACTQRTAEEMGVATRNLSILSAGAVNPENGVRTLFMRNNQTGQTADCRVNTIDGTVLAVTLTGGNTSESKPVNAQAACIQRTAEEMGVATRNVTVKSAGQVNAENGVRTLFMRNTQNGQTADCRVNTIDGTVLAVKLAPVDSEYWEVSGVKNNDLGLKAQPSLDSAFTVRGLRNGTILRNLGCKNRNGDRWCRVEVKNNTSKTGWARTQYLRESNGFR